MKYARYEQLKTVNLLLRKITKEDANDFFCRFGGMKLEKYMEMFAKPQEFRKGIYGEWKLSSSLADKISAAENKSQDNNKSIENNPTFSLPQGNRWFLELVQDFDGTYYRCPICKRIIFGTEKFCPECGQRLKW